MKMREAAVRLAGFSVSGYKCPCGEEMASPGDVERVRRAANSGKRLFLKKA